MLSYLEDIISLLDMPDEYVGLSDENIISKFAVYSTEKCFKEEFKFENCKDLCE
jgi:hypothetical protein